MCVSWNILEIHIFNCYSVLLRVWISGISLSFCSQGGSTISYNDTIYAYIIYQYNFGQVFKNVHLSFFLCNIAIILRRSK